MYKRNNTRDIHLLMLFSVILFSNLSKVCVGYFAPVNSVIITIIILNVINVMMLIILHYYLFVHNKNK